MDATKGRQDGIRCAAEASRHDGSPSTIPQKGRWGSLSPDHEAARWVTEMTELACLDLWTRDSSLHTLLRYAG